MSKRATIEQYLLATGLHMIDEFNEKFKDITKEELKNIADKNYNEMDMIVRVGYPFKETVHYSMGDSKKNSEQKRAHDLIIESKDYQIDIKYLKNWSSSSNGRSNSKTWDEFQRDFDWLYEEIEMGNKGKRAFIICWFNCVDSLSQYIQLGEGKGMAPKINMDRYQYFPFLSCGGKDDFAKNFVYDYSLAYSSLTVHTFNKSRQTCDCMFIGNEEDCFHVAIYF